MSNINDAINDARQSVSDARGALALADRCLVDAIEAAPPTPTRDHILALESAAKAHTGTPSEKRALVELLDIVREV